MNSSKNNSNKSSNGPSPTGKSPSGNTAKPATNFSSKVEEVTSKPTLQKRASAILPSSPVGKSPKDLPTEKRPAFMKRGSFAEIALKKIETEAEVEEPIKEKGAPIEIKIDDIDKTLKDVYQNNKTPLVLDTTGTLFSYINYKGNVCDFQDFLMRKSQSLTTKGEFLELMRLRLISAMKLGQFFALYLEEGVCSLEEFFLRVPWMKLPDSFIPENMKQELFFKSNFLKEEEDVDGTGKKGNFRLNSNFVLLVLGTGNSIEKLKSCVGLMADFFQIVKVI